MADKKFTEFLKALLFEAREKGLKVRLRQDGGIVIYAGEKKLIIILEDANVSHV